jgi:hypothetical protein
MCLLNKHHFIILDAHHIDITPFGNACVRKFEFMVALWIQRFSLERSCGILCVFTPVGDSWKGMQSLICWLASLILIQINPPSRVGGLVEIHWAGEGKVSSRAQMLDWNALGFAHDIIACSVCDGYVAFGPFSQVFARSRKLGDIGRIGLQPTDPSSLGRISSSVHRVCRERHFRASQSFCAIGNSNRGMTLVTECDRCQLHIFCLAGHVVSSYREIGLLHHNISVTIPLLSVCTHIERGARKYVWNRCGSCKVLVEFGELLDMHIPNCQTPTGCELLPRLL